MAYTPVLNDVLRLRIACKQNNQYAVNVLTLSVDTVIGGGATQDEIVTSIDASIRAHLRACLAADATYYGMTLHKILPVPPTLPSVILANAAGLGATNGNPPQVSSLISWKTAFAGRKFRGRMYVPFPPRGEVTATETTSAAQIIALGALRDDFVAGFNVVPAVGRSTLLNLYILNRRTNQLTRVTSGVVAGAYATQRRRGLLSHADNPPF